MGLAYLAHLCSEQALSKPLLVWFADAPWAIKRSGGQARHQCGRGLPGGTDPRGQEALGGHSCDCTLRPGFTSQNAPSPFNLGLVSSSTHSPGLQKPADTVQHAHGPSWNSRSAAGSPP